MANSRVNLAALAVALIAGLVILQDSQNILASLGGLALLIALLAFGQDNTRSTLQSLAFGLVCGLAVLGTVGFGVRQVAGQWLALGGQDLIPPIVWLLGAVVFFFVDRSNVDPGNVQATNFGGYAATPTPIATPTSAPIAASRPSYGSRPFTPAPVVSAPVVSVPEPEPVPTASAINPPPTPPPTASTPVPPVLTGKEVSIYVTMMGEGMNVLRSVRAEHLGRDFYIIVDEMPADENWEYVPGQVVRCKKKNLSNGKGLVAFEEAPRAQ